MRFILLIIVFVFQIFCVFSQSESENHEKYWYYRNRLKYFVKPGIGPGYSCVGSIRNRYNGQHMSFGGDQVIELGWYTGVLATEYKLLNNNNQNTEETLLNRIN